MGNNFWENKANEFNQGRQRPNTPPPNRNDGWNNGGGNNNVPPWGNQPNNQTPPWGGGGGNTNTQTLPPQTAAAEFVKSVFSFMFLALAVSGVTAFLFGTSASLQALVITETGWTGLGYVALFAPFIISLVMQLAYHRFSSGTLLGMLIAYSFLIGMSFSVLFIIYSPTALIVTFLTTSATFGAMALLGYTTKTDLTRFGGIMYMLFIGLLITSIVNIFIGSSALEWVISVVGLFVFTGLTAYWLQMLKKRGMDPNLVGMQRQKAAIIGGLQLYILFINLFLIMLRLFGGRD